MGMNSNANEAGINLGGSESETWPTSWPKTVGVTGVTGVTGASGVTGAPTVPGARTMLLIPQHVNAFSQPGSRTWEAALAMMLGICALALRRSRLPSLPSMPAIVRADPFVVAWTSVRLRRPTLPDAAWAVLGAVAAACLIGGPMAIPAALFGAIGTLIALARRRAKAGMRQKTRACAQVPPLADLFAAALAAGLQPADAAFTVAQAFGAEGISGRPDRAGLEPAYAQSAASWSDPQGQMQAQMQARTQTIEMPTAVREKPREALSDTDLLACRFHDAATALLAGTDAQAAWSALAEDEATAPLAAAVIRAGRTGAPAAATVARAAHELREAASAALLAEVHAVGVRATAPLAVCFLPAFVLLGVLPTALGLLSRVHA